MPPIQRTQDRRGRPWTTDSLLAVRQPPPGLRIRGPAPTRQLFHTESQQYLSTHQVRLGEEP